MMKQIQSLTHQISLMIGNQQFNLQPLVESGWHASGMWCIECGEPEYTKKFCKTRPNIEKMMIVTHHHLTTEGKVQTNMA